MTTVKRIINFYTEGFRSMTVGKKLWLIIFIKLFIMFAILKLFFFPTSYKPTSAPIRNAVIMLSNN